MSNPIQIIVELDPKSLPEKSRQDLEARAHLSRQPPSVLLAQIIGQKLGPRFKVVPGLLQIAS